MSVATSGSSDFPVSRISLRSCGLRAQNALQPVAPFGVGASPSDFQWSDFKDDLFLIFRIYLDPGPKSPAYLFPSRPTTQGAFRDRHERKAGMRWTRVALLTRALFLRTAKSGGPDASMVGVKWAEEIPLAMVTTKPDHQGEREVSR